MTIEMLLSGLVILTMVGVIVVSMTSTRNGNNNRFGGRFDFRDGRNNRDFDGRD